VRHRSCRQAEQVSGVPSNAVDLGLPEPDGNMEVRQLQSGKLDVLFERSEHRQDHLAERQRAFSF